MPPTFKHAVITRFNIPFAGSRHLDENWLERRFELCATFCHPSLRAQSCRDFIWLIAVHPRTPPRFISRLSEYSDGVDAIPWFTDDFTPPAIDARLRECWPRMPEWIITSRLDSDDAFSRDYVERVQCAARFTDPEFLNFRRGWVWRDGTVCPNENLSNPFLSFVERFADPIRTAYCAPHPSVASIAPVRQIEDAPGWLRVVHGGNVTTRVPAGKHRWLSASDLLATFGLKLNGSYTPRQIPPVDGEPSRTALPPVVPKITCGAGLREKSLTELFEEQRLRGFVTDKGTKHAYIPFYDLLFAKYRRLPIKLLEIGVAKGNSLLLWNLYFADAAAIQGLDIRLWPLREACPKVKLVEGSAVDDGIAANQFGGLEFEIIIDDASHALTEQLRTFELYYPKLKRGGIYVIEDVQSVKGATEAFADAKPTIVDLRKQKGRSDDVLFLFLKP